MAVAHDRKDPSAGIAALVALEAAITLKKRLLNDVIRYVGVTAEKACQVLRGIELKNDVPLEAFLCVDAHPRHSIELFSTDIFVSILIE
jgi:hypothetical protein